MASYYSKHNKDITFSEFRREPYTLFGHNLTAEAWGTKRPVDVCAEDVRSSGLDPKEYLTLIIGDDVRRLGPGVIESFPNLQDLIVESELKKLPCTPELEALLTKNNVILRGSFNSPAEKLANKLGLRFIHKNIFLAGRFDEEHYESSDITLCFEEGQPPFILRNDITQGWAASNSGGGTVRTDLPEDFYVGYDTAEAFADDYVGRYFWEKVRANQELDAFLKEANQRRK